MHMWRVSAVSFHCFHSRSGHELKLGNGWSKLTSLPPDVAAFAPHQVGAATAFLGIIRIVNRCKDPAHPLCRTHYLDVKMSFEIEFKIEGFA
jgi:hypothetical protein